MDGESTSAGGRHFIFMCSSITHLPEEVLLAFW